MNFITRYIYSQSWITLYSITVSIIVIFYPFFHVIGKRGDIVIWKQIRGAYGYRVQIRNVHKRIVQDKRVKQNFIPINHPEGKYSIRVSPLKSSGRTTVWSHWRPLNIVISRIPKLNTRVKMIQTVPNQRSFRFTLTGQYFLPSIKVEIRSGKTSIPVRFVQVRKKGKMLLVNTDLRRAAPGSYDLILSNPRNKRLNKKKFFIIARKIVVVRRTQHNTKRSQHNTKRTLHNKKRTHINSKRPYHNASFNEYRKYVMSLTRKCTSKDVPDILIHSCNKFFVTLDLSQLAKLDILNFLRITSSNNINRINGYEYFSEKCRPIFNPARELMNKRLKKYSHRTAPGEKHQLRRLLIRMNKCTSGR